MIMETQNRNLSIETSLSRVELLLRELAIATADLRSVKAQLIEQTRRDTPSIRLIQDLVCDHLSLPAEAMTSPIRTAPYCYGRQLAMWLCRALTKHSLTEIGRRFGGRSHRTVEFALGSLMGRRNTETKIRAEMDALSAYVRQLMN